MNFRNQNGMTLVEVMVAGGLLAGLAVAGMTLFKSQNKAQKTVEQNYEVTSTLGAIRTLLADPTNCEATLGGLDPNGNVDILNAAAPNGGIIKVVNGVEQPGVYAPGQLTGTSLQINNYRLRSTGWTPPVGTNETMLVISFSRGEGAIKDEITRTIKINYRDNPITDCYAVTSGHSDSLWQISTDDINDIYYNSGDVGIGKANPLTRLDVSGTATVVNNAGNLYNENLRLPPSAANDYSSISIGSDPAATSGTRAGQWTLVRYPLAQNNMFSVRHDTTDVMNFLTNGNVGIGTASPGTKVHVSNVGTGEAFRIDNPGSNWWSFGGLNSGTSYLKTYEAEAAFGNAFTGPLHFVTGNTNKVTILNDGNVGIGTTTPGSKLTVIGDIGVMTPAAGTAWIRPETNSDSYGLGFHGTRVRVGGVQSNASAGAALISSQSNADAALYARFGYILGDGLGAFEVRGQSGQSPRINLTNSTGVSTFYASSATGRVGIGTDAPAFPVDVRGSTINLQNAAGSADLYLQSTTRSSLNFYVGGNQMGTLDSLPGYFSLNSYRAGVPLVLQTGNITRMSFDHAGLASITGDLTVSGSVTATSFLYSSDARLKKKVETIQSPLDKISQLRGVNFTWKKDNKEDVGFIAQEVEKLEPSLVATADDGMKSVKYGNIVAIVVEAVKELHALILNVMNDQDQAKAELAEFKDELKGDLELIKSENQELRRKLLEQESRLKKQEELLRQLSRKEN